jgi:hypothetical protein
MIIKISEAIDNALSSGMYRRVVRQKCSDVSKNVCRITRTRHYNYDQNIRTINNIHDYK